MFKRLENDVKMRINAIRSELNNLEKGLLSMVKSNKQEYLKTPDEKCMLKKESSRKLIELTQNCIKSEQVSYFPPPLLTHAKVWKNSEKGHAVDISAQFENKIKSCHS